MTIATTNTNAMNGEVHEPVFDPYKKLKQRLETTKSHKESVQKQLQQRNDELQRLFGKIPKKPKESMQEMITKIKALEYKLTTASWTLAEEKKFMREIDTLQKQKMLLEEFHQYEKIVQEKKASITDLRQDLKTTITAIEELDSALQKILLAKKLGCAVTDLTHQTIECQSDKIGRVIGKQGATIKLLEEQCHVVMDVDSVAAKIKLTGSANAIAAAMTEIQNIILSVDVDVVMDKHVLGYLTSKRVTALGDIRKAHPGVTIEPVREKKHVQLRGLQQDVTAAKVALLMLDLVSRIQRLVGKEYANIVGKGGSTINKLVDDHQVMIDVDEVQDDEWLATITGPLTNVEECMVSINTVLAMNRDVVDSIAVDTIIRNTLLADAGAPIKKWQVEVNEKVTSIGGFVMLTFAKEPTTDNKVALMIKGRFSSVNVAKEMVRELIAKLQEALVIIDVDPFVVPRIIGKGGEIIKNIKDGKSIIIDVDKTLGRIVIHSQDQDEVKRVEAEINAIIKENQIARIGFQHSIAKSMFREISRSEHKATISALVWTGLDEESGEVVLRGTKENIEEATKIINNFVEVNYIEEIDVAVEDEPTLLVGGSESPISKLATELDVDLSMNKARYVIIVKGERAKVCVAIKRLDQFLNGGDGHTVSRIAVTEQALGVIIGKGGSKRSELEKKYEGIALFIHKSNRVTIRGPEQAVELCRIDILKLVSSVRIQQVMSITPEQHAILSKRDVIRRATNGIPVQVTLTENEVKIRGLFTDVRDAQALIKEPIDGFYEARVELDPSQLACVRGACRKQNHFLRMEEATNATVNLDLSMSSIIVTGERENVKRAKCLVIEFIDFLLAANFTHLKISKPHHATIGDATALADVAAISGAAVMFDRDTSSIEVQSSDPEKVKKAEEILKARIANAEKLAFVITLEESEAWLIPVVIGKGGVRVNALRIEVNCQVDVNKEDRTLTVSGENEEYVAKAKQALNEMIDSARRKCAFVQLPGDAIASFMGRAGANIKSFSIDHNVEVERLRKEPNTFKIVGSEELVKAAKDALMGWLSSWEERSAGTTIAITKNVIPAVIGRGGENVSFIQREFNCKVEINRDDLTVTVRGPEAMRVKALEKINQIINDDKAAFAARNGFKEAQVKSSETEPVQERTKSKSEVSNGAFVDNRRDRSSEFAARPVGLTIVEIDEGKNKKKRIRHKNKSKDISDDSTLQVGTTAGRNLFNLLVNEKRTPNTDGHANTSVILGPLAMSIDQWDASTVSSAKDDGNYDDEASGVVHVVQKVYIKSSSGFSVRV